MTRERNIDKADFSEFIVEEKQVMYRHPLSVCAFASAEEALRDSVLKLNKDNILQLYDLLDKSGKEER